VRDDWPAGVIPIGNAAAALEPVGGEGMGLAMRSAELAATAIADAIRRGAPLDVSRLRESFRALWTTRRLACRAAAVALSDARLGPIAVDAARCVPALARGGLRLVGK
jgi:flavin-dependent dehydrogenase